MLSVPDDLRQRLREYGQEHVVGRAIPNLESREVTFFETLEA